MKPFCRKDIVNGKIKYGEAQDIAYQLLKVIEDIRNGGLSDKKRKKLEKKYGARLIQNPEDYLEVLKGSLYNTLFYKCSKSSTGLVMMFLMLLEEDTASIKKRIKEVEEIRKEELSVLGRVAFWKWKSPNRKNIKFFLEELKEGPNKIVWRREKKRIRR